MVMKHPFTTGLSFGTTSGVITTLGLIVGLHSGTHSALAVIGGIITIAIAPAVVVMAHFAGDWINMVVGG